MFDRFSEAARQALFWARHSLSELGGGAIEPEHLLLGLTRGEGDASSILRSAGLRRSELRDRMGGGGPARPPQSVHVPFSAASTVVLQAAVSEADQMDCREIRTGHLLLGLLRNQDVPVFRMLHQAGVRLNDVRTAVARVVPQGPENGSHEGFFTDTDTD